MFSNRDFRGDTLECDVVVVGARCAGAATAMLLARAGHDVVLADRATLPRDTTSTHSLVRGGVVQLARWGLLEEVLASGAPAIRSVLFQQYGERAAGPLRRTVKDKSGVDLMVAPRRYILDDILATAAVQAGARLHTGTTVTSVVRSPNGRVVGVRATGPDGEPLMVRANLVVGADGVHSRMAKQFGARTQETHAPSGACLYTYVGGVPWDGFEFHLGAEAFAGVFPTHHEQACVWLIRPTRQARPLLAAGGNRVDAWLQALETTVPGLAHRVLEGQVEDRLRGAVGLPNHVRQAAGPGWALVGDAGYHRDPITGHGITDAFRDAELLAEAADLALRHPALEASAMTSYATHRDVALADTFRITRELATFPPAHRFVELQTELGRALDDEASRLWARAAPTLPAVSVC